MAAAYGFDPARAQTPILQVGIIYQATADGTSAISARCSPPTAASPHSI